MSKSGGDASHQGPTDAIVFLVVAMVLGVFTYHLLSFTRIPYTVLLLVSPPPWETDDIVIIYSSPLSHLVRRCPERQTVTDALTTAAVTQVWGVILGVGNQSFAADWNLVGAGTRAWEVSARRQLGRFPV